MKTYIKVTFSDGSTGLADSVTTGINLTFEAAKDYYLGKWFNLGGIYDPCEDRMAQAINVEEIPYAQP